MTNQNQHSEYRNAVEAARERFLPVFQSRIEKSKTEKAERLEERAEDKALCQKITPGVLSSIEQLIVAKNKDLEGLGSLDHSEETRGYFKTDDRGNLLTDEHGKHITDDEWLTGAELYFVPYGCGSAADVALALRKTRASTGDNEKESTEVPSQHEIDVANLIRSTATLTLCVAGDRTFLVTLDTDDTGSERVESQFMDKSDRVKDAKYCEYHDIDTVNHQFLEKQIERFLIICLGDCKIVDPFES